MFHYYGSLEYSKIVKANKNGVVPALSINPNPVKDRFILTGLKEGHSHIIQLIDANGRIVLKTKTVNAQISINMDSQISGIYWLKIITEESVITRKLIKQ